MNLKPILAKFTSVALIIFSLYQTLFSISAIFFIYPKLDQSGFDLLAIELGLIQKAIVIYLTMIVSGFFGVALLLKPDQEVKIAHIVFGILIFTVSIFFTIQTPFATDPLSHELFNFIDHLHLLP